MALDALDRSISAVLGSDQFTESLSSECGSLSQDVRHLPFLFSGVDALYIDVNKKLLLKALRLSLSRLVQ